MRYIGGSIGRVFIVKIEHGDNLLDQLQNLAYQEELKAAVVFLLGEIKKASIVAGPKECTVPPEQVWQEFEDGREILGIGTIFSNQDQPELHIHATFGKGNVSLTGCVREDAEVYLVVEAIVLELTGVAVNRQLDPELGLKMLTIH
ncbi:MAG: DUF296 domain-containing protein [Syntrophomonadaceae bacterium]|mgnify:CR=1 FL=1|nr:DUF296 domain-containing protein [Syntrophomonadaceae bacterium]